MTPAGTLQIALYLGALVALAWPLGIFMARVYCGERTWLSPALSPSSASSTASPASIAAASRLEAIHGGRARLQPRRLCRRLRLQRLQGSLPLNPQGFGGVAPDSAFNTAVSFATNTNWQGYGGETTMSYLTQMLGLGVQNFLSAATGMAVLVALIRGFVRRESRPDRQFLGRPHARHAPRAAAAVDVLAFVLVAQGVVQSFAPYRTVTLLEPLTIAGAAEDADRRRGRRPQRRRYDPAATITGADAPARPGREPGRDQAARHQRRRLLQREFRASAREPDAAVELPGDAGDPADPGGAVHTPSAAWSATRGRAGRCSRR